MENGQTFDQKQVKGIEKKYWRIASLLTPIRMREVVRKERQWMVWLLVVVPAAVCLYRFMSLPERNNIAGGIWWEKLKQRHIHVTFITVGYTCIWWVGGVYEIHIQKVPKCRDVVKGTIAVTIKFCCCLATSQAKTKDLLLETSLLETSRLIFKHNISKSTLSVVEGRFSHLFQIH